MRKAFSQKILSVIATFVFGLLMGASLRADSITTVTAEDLKKIIDLKAESYDCLCTHPERIPG